MLFVTFVPHLDYVMSGGGGLTDSPTGGTAAGLRPYLKRKKSSFGETKIAVLGHEGTGKSGKLLSENTM